MTAGEDESMVKLVCFLKRKEGMSLDEFYEHWFERHAPLIRSTPELARHVVRYEQHRRVPQPEWCGTPGYDGITVQWFDSVDEFLAFTTEPMYAELIEPDEKRFLDRDAFVWMITEEPVVAMDGPLTSEP
jgi:uncharacterized protein (TIGR02118 family)